MLVLKLVVTSRVFVGASGADAGRKEWVRFEVELEARVCYGNIQQRWCCNIGGVCPLSLSLSRTT